MKTGAIIRIIVWGVIALALIGVLAYFLMGGSWNALLPEHLERAPEDVGFGNRHEQEQTPVADPSIPPQAAAITDFSGVKKLKISWISGSVTILPTTGTPSASEDYSGEEKYRMLCRVSGDTLIIDAFDDSALGFWNWNLPTKHLTVSVPSNLLEEVEIETTSASVEVGGLALAKLDVETVSGSVSGVLWRAGEADIDTVSGEITITLGQCNELNVSTTSGAVEAVCYDGLQTAELDSVSGALRLTIPMGSNCTLGWDTVSGSLDDQTGATGNPGFGSAGTVEIDAETVSGGLRIQNAQQADCHDADSFRVYRDLEGCVGERHEH